MATDGRITEGDWHIVTVHFCMFVCVRDRERGKEREGWRWRESVESVRQWRLCCGLGSDIQAKAC